MPWDVDAAVEYLQTNAEPHSTGRCARYTREAIEAGGLTLHRHADAKDYGDSLERAGFVGYEPAEIDGYRKGDVVVFDAFPGHPHGHMEMYDGRRWISDFEQRDIYPGPAYRAARPSYTVYRYGVLWDSAAPVGAALGNMG
jgi:hypothetical protein